MSKVWHVGKIDKDMIELEGEDWHNPDAVTYTSHLDRLEAISQLYHIISPKDRDCMKAEDIAAARDKYPEYFI